MDYSDVKIEHGNDLDDIGLAEAWDGNPEGARKFVGFVHRQLLAMTTATDMPSPVLDRLKTLRSETRTVVDFLDGYNAAKS